MIKLNNKLKCASCQYFSTATNDCGNLDLCIDNTEYKPTFDSSSAIKNGREETIIEVEDMVNHPKHYKKNGMEAIDVIQAFTDGLNGIEATDTGNIIKYVLRWKDKNGVEDLKKIVWYANHLINYLEGK